MRKAAAAALFLAIAALPCPADAFYASQDGSLEARGFVRVLNWFSENPDMKAAYPNETDQGAAVLGRLLVDGSIGRHAGFELNVYQFVNAATASSEAAEIQYRDVERSSALEWLQRGDPTTGARMAVDRLAARLTYGRVDAIVGRQAVSLATCYYFTPNDFFAPFSAGTFYRMYKPGVDAARVEARLGPLTQLTLLSVLGYSPQPGAPNGWSGAADWDRTSYIAKFSTNFLDIDWTVLGGSVRGDSVIGGAIQADLFWSLGLRAEGHHRNPRDGNGDPVTEMSAQLERRFENSLILRYEGSYHGAGADTVSDYDAASGLYLGRWYSALGLSYEFTPLLYGEALAVMNHTDNSGIISLYSVYSITDEGEISLGVSVPRGKTPGTFSEGSEFGAYPVTVSVELRSHF